MSYAQLDSPHQDLCLLHNDIAKNAAPRGIEGPLAALSLSLSLSLARSLSYLID